MVYAIGVGLMKKTYKGYFKKIDFVFFNAKKIRKAIDEARQDKGHKNFNGSGIADPTAAVVINNLSPLRYVFIGGNRLEWPERWLKLVDLVYANATDFGRECLDGFYVRGESYEATYTRIHVHQSTHSRAWKELKHLQELYAVQLGLIRVI